MPIRLGELKNITQGERASAVIAAVTELGLASIADVVQHVARRFELKLEAENTLEAFKKSIRTDLKKLSGHTLGTAYFTKDLENAHRVHEDDLEFTDNGKVKNIYNIKYFMFGSNAGVPGGNLMSEEGGLFIPQHNQAGDLTVDWEISSFKSFKKNHLHIVLKKMGGEFVCITAPLVDLPIKILIAHGVNTQGYLPEKGLLSTCLGNRYAMILWPDSGISRPKKDGQLGHAIIEFGRDASSITLTDLNSTNGSKVTPLAEEFLNKQLIESNRVGTKRASEENEDLQWVEIKSANEVAQKCSSAQDRQATGSRFELPVRVKLGKTDIFLFTK